MASSLHQNLALQKAGKVLWNGYSVDAKPGDQPVVHVIGVDSAGNETVLYNLNTAQQNFDISSVNVHQYPYLRITHARCR